MMRRVLFVIPDVPYPLVSGGHYRDWQLVNLLARLSGRPHVLYFGAGEQYVFAPGNPMETLCASITYGGARREVADRNRWAKLVRKLGYLTGIGGSTFPFSCQYDVIGAGRTIVETARRVGAEVVVLRSFWCHLAPALRAVGCKIVANCPDYNTVLAWEMVRSMRGMRKVAAIVNYLGVRRQERKFLPLCDEIWMPTDAEARAVRRLPVKRVLVMPNLLDAEVYPDYSNEEDDGTSLLFVANYGYPPNANAAELLLRKIFPEIKQRFPTARLILVGRGLSTTMVELARSSSGVEAVGFVENLQPFYRRAAVVLLPVSEGAGMLFKALEALSFGRPVVGFPQAFRGLNGENDHPYLVAGSASDLADQAVRLLSNRAWRSEMAKRTRAYASEHVSWKRGMMILQNSLVVQ